MKIFGLAGLSGGLDGLGSSLSAKFMDISLHIQRVVIRQSHCRKRCLHSELREKQLVHPGYSSQVRNNPDGDPGFSWTSSIQLCGVRGAEGAGGEGVVAGAGISDAFDLV